MTLSVSIIDRGFSQAINAAVNLSAKTLQPELNQAGKEIVSFIEGQFRAEVDPFGNPWEPLSSFTALFKGSLEILTETGQLSESFQADVVANGLSIFTNRRFPNGDDATKHQFGGFGSITGGEVPARPMLPMEGVLPDRWLKAVADEIAAGVQRTVIA